MSDISINDRYGRLTVIGKYKRSIVCQCDCGKQKIVPPCHLSSNRVKSCGCLKKDLAKIKPKQVAPSLTGRKIGLLTILETVGKFRGEPIYRYRCICGKTGVSRRCHLVTHRKRYKTAYPKSCGCRGKGFIERFTDTDGIQKWRMIDSKELVPIGLHEEERLLVKSLTPH